MVKNQLPRADQDVQKFTNEKLLLLYFQFFSRVPAIIVPCFALTVFDSPHALRYSSELLKLLLGEQMGPNYFTIMVFLVEFYLNLQLWACLIFYLLVYVLYVCCSTFWCDQLRYD